MRICEVNFIYQMSMVSMQHMKSGGDVEYGKSKPFQVVCGAAAVLVPAGAKLPKSCSPNHY